jgi:hypothetical protein
MIPLYFNFGSFEFKSHLDIVCYPEWRQWETVQFRWSIYERYNEIKYMFIIPENVSSLPVLVGFILLNI